MYDVWPPDFLDHINGDRLDNRICNLRLATWSENAMNAPKRRNNTSGYKGVFWDAKREKWMALIGIDGRYRNLGRYDTKEEAFAAYCAGCKKYHGEFARVD